MTPSPPIIIDTWKRKERLMAALDETAAAPREVCPADAPQSGKEG